MANRIGLIIIALTVLSLINPLYATHAEGSTTIQVAPSTTTVGIGTTFTLDVTVTDVTELAVWEFRLFYLNTILNCTNITEGPLLKAGGSTFFDSAIRNAYNATHGWLTAGSTLLGQVPGVNGSGTLATITFQAIAAGDTPLQFSNDPLITFLFDSSPPPRNPIPFTTIDGTVHVTANPPPQVIISPNSAAIDLGQSVFFTLSFQTGGTPPYTFQWYLNGSAVSGATSSSWNFTPTSTGSYKVYLNVTDSLNVKSQSNTATVITNPVPTVSITPTTAVIEVAQSQLFTSTVSGGTSPYSYQWYLNETLVSGATSGSWTFTPASAGSYTVYAKMTDAVGMQATSNNATVTVNIPVYVHNVAITNVTSYKTVVAKNYTLNINVTATNLGDLPETFNVTVYANTTVVETQTVNSLLNGTSTQLSFSWNTTGAGKGNYTISAYAQPVSGETNTADNNFTSPTPVMVTTLPGDLISPFGVVDMKDIAYVAKRFGATPTAPLWDTNTDINGDGKIDMKDIAIVARGFGNRYP